MKLLLSGVYAYYKNRFQKTNILISDGTVVDISDTLAPDNGCFVYNLNNCFIIFFHLSIFLNYKSSNYLTKFFIRAIKFSKSLSISLAIPTLNFSKLDALMPFEISILVPLAQSSITFFNIVVKSKTEL